MFWLPILILLASWCLGSDSQPVITQPPTSSVTPRQTVKLSCVMRTGLSISDYRMYWYQQKSENPPRYLLHYYSDSDKGQGSGVPSRFSGSKDTSSNTGYLTIAGALAEDEADYHCALWHSDVYIFGGGTHLTVTGQPAVAPTVHVFPPSAEEMKTTNKATMVCMMSGFHPGVVQVDWLADGNVITEGVETAKPSKQNDKYVASSYLTVNNSDWERHQTFTCKVTHEGNPITKSVDRSQCP